MEIDIWQIVNSVITLFIIMLVGVAGRISGILDVKTTKKLSQILVKITQPMLIIASMQIEYTDEKLKIGLWIVAASAIVHIIATLIAGLIFGKYPSKQGKVYRMGTIFGNCAFMGFPILKAVFGDVGLFYGAFYTFFFNIYLWTYGVFMLSKGTGKKVEPLKAIVNIGTISCAVSIILYVTRIRFPAPILNSINMIGDMTFPLAMLIIGSLICNSSFKKLFASTGVYFYSLIKLLMLPLLTLVVCIIFRIDVGMTWLLVTMAAVPSATNNAIFAEIYDGDASLGARLVGLSTLLSIASMPIVLIFTKWILSLVYG